MLSIRTHYYLGYRPIGLQDPGKVLSYAYLRRKTWYQEFPRDYSTDRGAVCSLSRRGYYSKNSPTRNSTIYKYRVMFSKVVILPRSSNPICQDLDFLYSFRKRSWVVSETEVSFNLNGRTIQQVVSTPMFSYRILKSNPS